MGAPVPNDPRLKGPFKPMRFEADVPDCIVTEGEIPEGLNGGFYRCGPTWRRPTKQGTDGILSMDGMVQGLIFHDGQVDHRNRWIRTPKFLLEEQHKKGMFEWSDGDWGDWRTWGYGDVKRDQYTTGVPQGTNNINIFPFAGELLASGEQGGPPIAIDPLTLDTRGIVPWSSKLSRGIAEPAGFGDASFTAHPKWDDDTGELYGWVYKDEPPYVTLHWVSPDGAVRTRALDDAPYEAVAHDMWLTQDWVVMPFQPFIATRERIRKGLSIFGWDEALPIVVALIPRDDPEHGEIKWIKSDLEPQYVMHTLAANQRGNKIELDAPIFSRPPFPLEQDFKEGDEVALFFSIAKSTLGRWTIDLDKGTITSERLDDRPAELPKVDERYYGKGYKWGYMIGGDVKGKGMSMKSLVVRNMETQAEQVYKIRHDEPAAVLEGTFAPRHADAGEGDGYLLVPVSRWASNSGEYLIFDTEDITEGPICRIEIPFALGWTPHGHWMGFDRGLRV
jgi:carotenoid cleavage dioxygenase-like enzyme